MKRVVNGVGVRLVCVVGPSGAGKDSVLRWVQQNWGGPGGLHLARRTITRPADAGAEAHEAVDLDEFAALRDSGAFACHWSAHGLHYGIRNTELLPVPRPAGAYVLFNGSRAHLGRLVEQFPELALLHITADAAILNARLQARLRESVAEVRARLLRDPPALPALEPARCLTLRNEGSLADAGQRVLLWLQALSQARV